MNLLLQLREVLVIESRSIEFDFGFHTYVFVDESSIEGKRGTGR